MNWETLLSLDRGREDLGPFSTEVTAFLDSLWVGDSPSLRSGWGRSGKKVGECEEGKERELGRVCKIRLFKNKKKQN